MNMLLILIEMFLIIVSGFGLMIGVMNNNDNYIKAAQIVSIVNLIVIVGGILLC